MRVWHLGAVICGAKTCYLGATYYGADPKVYFCKKLQKEHICEILLQKVLNCKNYGRSPRSRAARAGRPAAGRPAPQGLARNFLPEIFFRNARAALLPGGQVPAARQRGGRVIFL